MRAAALYEAHLAQKTDSHNTRGAEMAYFASLYGWAKSSGADLENMLLAGEGLTPPQVRSFAAWIRAPRAQANGVIPLKKRRSINAVFRSCSAICAWFIAQFSNPSSSNKAQRSLDVERLIEAQKRAWKSVLIKVRKDPAAPDMLDEEIAAIEQFLKPNNRSSAVGERIAYRDYLMWRMAIELGLRKGEILAMRTSDCPTRNAPYFKIERIEERGSDYADPRPNPPRPKTLSRDLGLLLDSTVFPKLVSDYVSAYRYKMVVINGKKQKRFLLQHKFLIVAQNGEPLSLRAADDVAKAIKCGTGVDFNWHLARHSFFNRAYAAVAGAEDEDARTTQIADIVHWGGWESAKSLEVYSRRARAERARHALMIWREGENQWNALT
jgi:integrase